MHLVGADRLGDGLRERLGQLGRIRGGRSRTGDALERGGEEPFACRGVEYG
ncbi:MAG TPA: hypothetical protein VFP78_11540 [Solirubrobacteraceae bacterium]|nr:hypothetical protein [Solirubrobacteraceae bacterium]